MKRLTCLVMLFMFVMFGVAMAAPLVDDSIHTNADADAHSTSVSTAIAGSTVHNDVDNNIRNSNENRNSNVGVNKQQQGQLQGQLQGQKQTAVGKVEVTDNSETKTTAIAFPSVAAAEGTNSASATYLFGSLGKANTETYKRVIPEIQTVLAIPDAIMSNEMKKDIITTLVKKMTDANRTQRLLGVLWEDNSKNLLNLFGLLTWDSFWAEGQKPLQCKSDISK